MNSKEILRQALLPERKEHFMKINDPIRSLDKPDPVLDAIWADEAEKRLYAYRHGKLDGIPMEKVF